MADGNIVHIEALVDERRLDGFAFTLLALSFLTMLTDGYELQAAAFAAPGLVKTFHLSRATLGPMFSASLVGALVGAPLLGWVGDRFGRKVAVIAACLSYAIFSLASAAAGSLQALILLRFLTGVGVGGLLPNMIALNTELTPRRYRAAFVTLIFIGVTAGGAAPGLVTVLLGARFGWPAIFVVGGITPLVLAGVNLFALPESAAFLVLRPARRAELARLVRRISPETTLDAETALALRPPSRPGGDDRLRRLFEGRLKTATPLLWLMFVSTLLTIYLLTSWLPLLLESQGFTPGRAAGVLAMFQLGGSVGGVFCSLVLGRWGWKVVVGLFALALASTIVLGGTALSANLLDLAVGVCGLAVLGAQFGLNTLSGLLYPAPLRARGVGIGQAIGRFGSIAGPLLGGLVAVAHVPASRLFLLPQAVLAMGMVAAAMVVLIRPTDAATADATVEAVV